MVISRAGKGKAKEGVAICILKLMPCHFLQRVYSPISFGKKYDKEGKFIKKCVQLGVMVAGTPWLPPGFCLCLLLTSYCACLVPPRFLPVLKDFPAKYIYEPWTAPLDVQQRAKWVALGLHLAWMA